MPALGANLAAGRLRQGSEEHLLRGLAGGLEPIPAELRSLGHNWAVLQRSEKRDHSEEDGKPEECGNRRDDRQ